MLELPLCGRSPPGPPPRSDSGRAVSIRPPCALHQRTLMLRGSEKHCWFGFRENLALAPPLFNAPESRRAAIERFPKRLHLKKNHLLKVVRQRLERVSPKQGLGLVTDARGLTSFQSASDAEQSELVSWVGVDLDPVGLQNRRAN